MLLAGTVLSTLVMILTTEQMNDACCALQWLLPCFQVYFSLKTVLSSLYEIHNLWYDYYYFNQLLLQNLLCSKHEHINYLAKKFSRNKRSNMPQLSPYFRTPFTDLTGSLINHQTYDKCGEFEMNMMDCLEAYGADRGKIKCKDLVDDFNECFLKNKQWLRYVAMRNERNRQYRAGELKPEDYNAPPPKCDAY